MMATNNPSRVLVNESNLATGIVYKHKSLVENINFWHKFMISNTQKYQRNTILRAILDHVHPLDLIPVSFGTDRGTSHFLARNCGPAITKLAKDNLTVPNPEDISKPFKISIILKFATTNEFKVDVQKNINTVLMKRYDTTSKTLNLTSFHEDKGLSEFCPLSQPKIMFFVLHLSKVLTPVPEKFILKDNQIKLLNPLDALNGIKGITYFDLSNNLIDKAENLSPLSSFEVTELLLNENPLCNNFKSIYEYIKCVGTYCPRISTLDGVSIKEGSFPTPKANFLCNPESYAVTSQFVEYFFTIYDSGNRKRLEDLYHKFAMFSLTSSYIAGQISSGFAQLRPYNNVGRNLLKLADLSKSGEYLFKGGVSIMNIFNQLPATDHDPFSFQIDVILKTPNGVVINVTGVFRELPQNLLDSERQLGFSRTFVLERSKKEWSIVNEQLHVYNALNIQLTSSFKFFKPQTDVIPAAKNVKDQQQLAHALKIITNLNANWARKCLEECNYDLKKALTLFVDLYKVDKIPPEAFVNKIEMIPVESREQKLRVQNLQPVKSHSIEVNPSVLLGLKTPALPEIAAYQSPIMKINPPLLPQLQPVHIPVAGTSKRRRRRGRHLKQTK